MEERLQEYLGKSRKEITKDHNDYTFFIQNKMKSLLNNCASDT